jgi:hypothetical protein
MIRQMGSSGVARAMNATGRAGVALVLLAAAFALGNREVHAQIQPQPNASGSASILNKIQAGNEECKRQHPDPVKQAIAYATCENRNMELLRPSMVYPDLMDQELANNLMLAEKVQTGKMTLIEMKAMKAQLHSQVVTEFARRQLAKTPTSPNPVASATNTTGFIGQTSPVVQASPQPHCQTARFGMMLGMSCN